MIQYLRRLDRRDLCVLLFSLSFAGLIYSKWFLSICLLSLLPLAFLNISWSPAFKIRFRKNSRQYFQVYASHPPYWALGLIVLVILVSVCYTGPSEYLWTRLRIKAPLLIAPLLIAFVPPISKHHLKAWMLAIIGIGVVSLVGVLGHYYLNIDAIHEAISKGQSIPTPISHIRYSLVLVLCLICCIWLGMSDSLSQKIRWLMAPTAIFLIAGLHILSVRSGLLSTYLVLLLSLIYIIIKMGNWKVAIIGLSALILLPILAYNLSPALRAKISYTRYDLQQYFEGKGANYSDSERIASLHVGWEVFKKNKWLGTGVANFKEEIQSNYGKNYPDRQSFKLPHNQYLSLLGSLGIIGFVISMFGFLLPLFWRRQYRFFPLLAFYLVILSSMLFENTWETTVGLNLFLLPVLLMLNYLSGLREGVEMAT